MWYIALIVLAADQITKLWVINSLPVYESRVLIPGVLSVTNVPNTGAFFGLLPQYNNAIAIISMMIACGMVVFLWLNRKLPKRLNLALIFIVSGAVSNIADRLWHNAVIDFINLQFMNFPIFNIADVIITLGAVMLVWHLIRS
ncbi:MAG: signal peptidase II [Clostridiales bacterium]|jgi:signal peptidase II|nr:signal peptidase II [Clostridiales bacterium]